MRRTAFSVILAGIILLGGGESVAQKDRNDFGKPDSIMIVVTGPTTATNDSSVTVELYFLNDRPIITAGLLMFWDNPVLQYDSVRKSPAAQSGFNFPLRWFPPSRDSINVYQYLTFLGLTMYGIGLPATSQPQLVATYYMHLTSWPEGDQVCIDRGPRDNCAFVDTAHTEFVPSWRGEVCLDLSAVPTVVDDLSDFNLPVELALKQNYPNPFNPITSIEYSLPVSSRVRLVVFNMLGQEVVTLVDAVRSAGTYFAEWNGCDAAGNRVASGLYLYRLQAGEAVQTRKMLLLK